MAGGQKKQTHWQASIQIGRGLKAEKPPYQKSGFFARERAVRAAYAPPAAIIAKVRKVLADQ
jgi:hypothetical protein